MTPIGEGNQMYADPERAKRFDLAEQGFLATATTPEFKVEDANSVLAKLVVKSLGDKEVQLVKVNATNGTFKLKVTLAAVTKETAAIKFNATIGEVEAALVALSNVEPGDITVTGTAGEYTLTFNVGANVAQVEGVDGGLTGGEAKTEISTSTAGTASGTLKVALETEYAGDWYVVGEFPEATAADASVGKAFGPLGSKCRWKVTLGSGDGARIAIQVSSRN